MPQLIARRWYCYQGRVRTFVRSAPITVITATSIPVAVVSVGGRWLYSMAAV